MLSGANGPRGYWTSTTYINYNNELAAYVVDYYSHIMDSSENPTASNSKDLGIRPVITIPKANMSLK